MEFEINISGQNLVDVEIGMILFGLEAFNSEIWPMTLGSMSGRGYGRFGFKLLDLYCLGEDNLDDWMKNAAKDGHAGYFSLGKPLDESDKSTRIKAFRKALLNGLGGK